MIWIKEDDGTKRYKKDSINSVDEEYLFGCEFEFYPNREFEIDTFIKELFYISEVDLLVNELTIPKCKDSENCMHLKKDLSLDDEGFEISTPKTSYHKLVIYIEKISFLIKKYGYTNADTGFHIHISIAKKSGVNLDFHKFALLCDENGLLRIWESRNEHCRNVMDIISSHTKNDSRRIKNKKGKVWNLEKIANNRVEIRTMGGVDYHLKIEQILEELNRFFEVFKETLSRDSEEYIKLRDAHIKRVKSLPKEQISEFSKLFLRP